MWKLVLLKVEDKKENPGNKIAKHVFAPRYEI